MQPQKMPRRPSLAELAQAAREMAAGGHDVSACRAPASPGEGAPEDVSGQDWRTGTELKMERMQIGQERNKLLERLDKAGRSGKKEKAELLDAMMLRAQSRVMEPLQGSENEPGVEPDRFRMPPGKKKAAKKAARDAWAAKTAKAAGAAQATREEKRKKNGFSRLTGLLALAAAAGIFLYFAIVFF